MYIIILCDVYHNSMRCTSSFYVLYFLAGDDSDKNFSEPPSPVFSRSASVGDTATFDAANPLQHEFQMKEWKGELDKVSEICFGDCQSVPACL